MATCFWKCRTGRKDVLVVRYRDAAGKLVEEQRPNDRTKHVALQYARDVERQAELQRKGLLVEARPVVFGDLWDSWWKLEGIRRRAKSRFAFHGFLTRHLGELRPMVLTPGTAGLFAARLEKLLAALEDDSELGPQSLNHLRAGVNRMFEHGKDPKVGLWVGQNPVEWVTRRRVPRTAKETLAHHEVASVLEHLPEPRLGAPWRWAAAICLYLGARPGESFGLRKNDVDLERGLVVFRFSWDAPQPKDNEPRTVLVSPELRPYLQAAIAVSPSDLVLPRVDGSCFDDSIRHGLVDHLRRATSAAGFVLGYQHTCRRCKSTAKKTGAKLTFTWPFPDNTQRTCASCSMKLWIKPIPRPIRFYDLRHTHATLLLGAGVELGRVSKALGHSDPKITANTYDHSELEGQRAVFANVLTFKKAAVGDPAVGETADRKNDGPGSEAFARGTEAFEKSGRQDSNLRPLAPQACGARLRPETRSTRRATGDIHSGSILAGCTPGPCGTPARSQVGGPRGDPPLLWPGLRARLERLNERFLKAVPQ